MQNLKLNVWSFFAWLKRVHLSIQIGERANDYQEIAARDKLSELQLRVRQLLDQVDQIGKEQNYQRVSIWLVMCGEWDQIIHCVNWCFHPSSF